MNGWDILIIVLLALAVTAAIIFRIKKRRKGEGCCGDCSSCCSDCLSKGQSKKES